MSDPQPNTSDRRSETETRSETEPRSETNHGRARNRDTLNPRVMQWVSALAAVAGLWLVASPFLFESTDTAVWNNTLTGTAIFLLAGYNFYRLSRDHLALVAVAALVVLLGLWAVASPFVIDMGSNTLRNSTIGAGLVAAAVSAYNAYENNRADVAEQRRART